MHNLNQYAPRVDNQYVPSSYKQSQELKTNFSKIILSIALLIAPLSARSLAQDYNGNLISKNKIILNSKSSNSYIQSLTTHTINFDGLLDQTFGNNPTNDAATPLGTTFLPFKIAGGGTNYTDRCNSIAIQSDGKIVMGGYSTDISGYTHFAAARYLPNGQLDSSFGGPAAGYSSQPGTMFIARPIQTDPYDQCNSIAIQPDGKIVMGGYASPQSNHNQFAAARLLPNGALDQSFGGPDAGYQTCQPGTLFLPYNGRIDQCKSIAIQPDGKIVMGGQSHDPHYFAAARLLSNGALDPSFGGIAAGYSSNPGTLFINPKIIIELTAGDSCQSIALQSDGKIVMGGKSGIAGNTHFSAARLLSNGQLDSSFGGYNSQAGTMYINQHITPDDWDDNCNSIAIQSDGKIVMGGYASSYQNTHWRFAAARLLSNGQLDSSFGNNTSGPIGTMYIAQSITNDTYSRDDQCKSIALQSDGKIVMGGYSVNNFALAQLINPMTLQTYQTSYAKVGAGLYV